jgi:glyoxylase-like metal-dependent hydrolase (beta-lactamase superfamily II)
VSLCDGFLQVDGGAMFGSVPKPLWEQEAPPDARNRIRVAMRPLIVRGARTMIIDAGVGDKEDAAFVEAYGLDRAKALDQSLAEAGIAPEAIDLVLASHLQFDHAGGFTIRDAAGASVRGFRARSTSRGAANGTMPGIRTPGAGRPTGPTTSCRSPRRASFQLVDDDVSIMPGVRVRRTGGYTMHHQIVLIESGGKTAAFAADLVPTAAHLPEAWIAGVDLYPMETLAAKTQFLKEAVERNTLVFFEHDPAIAAGVHP